MFSSFTLTTFPNVPSPRVARILSENKKYKLHICIKGFYTTMNRIKLIVISLHLWFSCSITSPSLYAKWPSSSSVIGGTAWKEIYIIIRIISPHTSILILIIRVSFKSQIRMCLHYSFCYWSFWLVQNSTILLLFKRSFKSQPDSTLNSRQHNEYQLLRIIVVITLVVHAVVCINKDYLIVLNHF